MEEIQDQRNIIFNHILLIYKHVYLSRNYESLNFIGLKYYILKTQTLEEKIAQNDPHKKCNFLKKWQVISNMLPRLILKE